MEGEEKKMPVDTLLERIDSSKAMNDLRKFRLRMTDGTVIYFLKKFENDAE